MTRENRPRLANARADTVRKTGWEALRGVNE